MNIFNFIKSHLSAIPYVLLAACLIYIFYLKYDNAKLINSYETQITEVKNELTTKSVELKAVVDRYDQLINEKQVLLDNLDSLQKLIEDKNETISKLESFNYDLTITTPQCPDIALDSKNTTKGEFSFDILNKKTSDMLLNNINSVLDGMQQ